MSAEQSTDDYDVVVVGSGFGGSATALRLAEKGYSVLVLEAGRRFADEDFAKTSWNVPRYVWAPALKCFGVQRIHKLPDVLLLAGAGVGGGSLNYANTLYQPPAPFFEDPQWGHITDWQAELDPHYAVAKRMLGVVEQNPCEGPIEQIMRDTAADLGVSDTLRKTPVGVFFGTAGKRVADPYFGGAGPDRTGCTECGNCMVGCRVGAKNTLCKNYLALAEGLGVRIQPLRTVTGLDPLGDRGFRVTTRRTGAWVKRDEQTLTAAHVVVAAGTWGTQSLLHTMRASGRLPALSATLGRLTRTNSEALEGAAAVGVDERLELDKGVAITTSFHVDANTHVENVRYGKGSNLMGLLSTVAVDGSKPRRARLLEFARKFVTEPVSNLKALGPRWSERTVILLVMQNLDNSLTTSVKNRFGRWRLTSRQGHGSPNPTYIPQAHLATDRVAARMQETSGVRTISGTTWAELFGVPMTAHFLGGAVISDSPEHGVIDPYHRVWGYPRLHVVDGAAVSANLGVNPALTITAQAERAASLWPAKGEADERPAQGETYVRLGERPAQVPGVPLGMPTASAAHHTGWQFAPHQDGTPRDSGPAPRSDP